jgi:Winged helix-turn helix
LLRDAIYVDGDLVRLAQVFSNLLRQVISAELNLVVSVPTLSRELKKLKLSCQKPERSLEQSRYLSPGEWMAGIVGLFYADGHVRVDHGSLTELPRRYVARRAWGPEQSVGRSV